MVRTSRVVIPEKPSIICFGGPSTAGKDTVITEMRSRYSEWVWVPRHTTRKRREGERNGREYIFHRQSEFNRLLKEGVVQYDEDPHDTGDLYAIEMGAINDVVVNRKKTAFGAFGSHSFRIRDIFMRDTPVVLLYIFADSASLLRRLRAERRGDNYQARMRRFTREFSTEGQLFDRVFMNNDGRSIEEVVEEIIGFLRMWESSREIRIAGFRSR